MQVNPYQAPASPRVALPQNPASPPARPTVITVFGVLNLVFGGLGIVSVIATLILLNVASALPTSMPNPVLDAMRDNAGYRTFTYVATGLGSAACIVLIVSGIGLLQMRPYGRTLAIAYGIYGVVAGLAALIANITMVFGPMMQKMHDLPGPQQAGVMGGLVGGVIGGAVGMAFPVILLFFMYRPNVISALRR
jgi:hypothetical protein